MLPTAGQVYKAPSPRARSGWRYIKIEQVRRADTGAYVLVHETGARGGKLLGDDPLDQISFRVTLDGGKMPSAYTLLE